MKHNKICQKIHVPFQKIKKEKENYNYFFKFYSQRSELNKQHANVTILQLRKYLFWQRLKNMILKVKVSLEYFLLYKLIELAMF